MHSVPVATTPLLQPADAYQAEILDRIRRTKEAHHRFERHGGQKAVECAASLMKLFRESNMAKALQHRILVGLHEIHDAGVLVVDSNVPVALNFPKSIDALYNRGDAGRVLDADIKVKTTSFCIEAMLQTAQTVDILRTDIGDTIQSILLDESIRPGLFLMETRDGERREYVDVNGNVLRGTHCHHGSMWFDLLNTVPEPGVMLAVIVHTDGVDSCGRSEKPISIQLANFPNGDGCGDRRIRCFALSAEPSIRVPRGTTIHETLGPEQAAQKLQVKAAVMADALSDLEAMAQFGAEFWVRDMDNARIRVKMYPRLLIIQADMAEQQALLGMAPPDCHGCFGKQHASRDRGGARGEDPRPHMSLEEGGYCETAQQRNVLNTCARQAAIIRVARTKTKAEAHELETELGVKFLVENSLNRLSHLIRHETQGPYGVFSVDLLHAFKTGIIPRMTRVIDSLMISRHLQTDELVSREDVRHFVDDRLMQLPQQYRKPSFALGFWSGHGVGSIKGEEATTLLELLVIVFVGCDILIHDKHVRLELLKLSRNILIIVKEAYTQQW